MLLDILDQLPDGSISPDVGTKWLTVKISMKLDADFTALAKKRGLNKAFIVRQLLKQLVEEEEQVSCNT